MLDIETVSEAFIKFMEDNSFGTWEQDLFLNQVPDSAPEATYWVKTSGGTPIQTLATGEKVKQYFISVFYRDTKSKNVERTLFRLEELLNCPSCVQLEGFEVLSIEANQFPSEDDIDSENRRIAFLQANIQTYKKEC